MTEDEIKSKIEENRSELRELRFAFAVARSVQDPAKFKKLKRDVARMQTVLRERELGISSQKEKTDRKKKK
jgi:large subunit ribosomal protein L29